jgi:cytochrome c-type biogenesis protein CcmH
MIAFWIICALLLALALAFVVLPLWRGATRNNAVVRDAANLEIFRDQIAEMDRDLANGLLTPELYAQGKRELQARMVEEVKSPAGAAAAGAARHPVKVLAVVLAVLIPLTSVGMYWKLGNQDVFLAQNAGMDGPVLSGEALKELEAKLAKNPENPQGWLLLARSYVELEQYKDAVRAYDKLTQLVPNEAQLWADYADALAMTQGQSLVGAPSALLDKALALDPNQPKALALAGSAAMERGDYQAAVKYWGNLQQQLPDKNSDMAQAVAGGLQQARELLAASKGGRAPRMMAGAPAAAGGKERITGTVTLGAAVKAQADPGDVVYVLARAENGPPMPLAVVRTQVKDLPLRFSLDDSNAVTPQAKLSDAAKVVIVARVSKSGNAMPQPGDLQGASTVVKPGSAGVKITIDSVVK